MKIATFNINNINRRLPNLIAWLKKAKPDVVSLQELKASHEKFPISTLKDVGYHCAWVGQKTWNGVAILSKQGEPIVTRRALPGDSDDVQARYLEAVVSGVVVTSIYLPNGNPQPGPKFDYKQAWFKRLQKHAKLLLRLPAPVVLAGDYNVAPRPEDIYKTTSWDDDALIQPASRAAYKKLLRQGWSDALMDLHPDEPIYTFWDYKRHRWERDAGLRLDHLLLNPAAEKLLTKGGVDRWVRGQPDASDHAPAWIDITPSDNEKAA